MERSDAQCRFTTLVIATRQNHILLMTEVMFLTLTNTIWVYRVLMFSRHIPDSMTRGMVMVTHP